MQTIQVNLIPGTQELLHAYASKLEYATFERKSPDEIQFIVADEVVVGCCILYEKTGEGLFQLTESAVDEEELEDWVERESKYTYISALEVWEEYRNQGYGSTIVELIKRSSKFPIALYAVAESMTFWHKHTTWMSGYWFCQTN